MLVAKGNSTSALKIDFNLQALIIVGNSHYDVIFPDFCFSYKVKISVPFLNTKEGNTSILNKHSFLTTPLLNCLPYLLFGSAALLIEVFKLIKTGLKP